MNDFDRELTQRLDVVRQQGLLRELRRIDSPQAPGIEIGGRKLLNFSSNDYLGLANEPALKEAAIRAVERYGAGAGASRLICGSLAPQEELDEVLAAFEGTEAAVSFSTGYAAAIGTICALLGKADVVVIDKLAHACAVDAARLCGATLRVFDHNDLNDLEAKLKWAAERVQSSLSNVQSREARVLVVTDSVFSMDGDHAPLREIVALKEEYGAWLMVDEAHATGLYGANRRGLAEELGVSDRIEVKMGTLGKALGASGGYICGSRALIDYLINRARTLVFSTAPVPAAAAAATAGVRFVQSSAGEDRRRKLWQNVSALFPTINHQFPPLSTTASAIIPIMLGAESKAVEAAAALLERGIFIPAIRYPTVARGEARLRLTLSAVHTQADLAQLLAALKSLNLGLRTSDFDL
jgi:8-amino-7-oxononanoate synthase